MLLDTKDMPIVAMDFMNDVHAKDIEIINTLYDALLSYETVPSEEHKERLIQLYREWFEHTIEHFHGEEVLMVEKKFPPYQVHKGEHDRALALMDDVLRNFTKTGDIAGLKQYITQVVPQWFVQHIQSMDTVTAMFFKSGMSPCSMH
jgi:hemerythrin